MYFGPIGRQKDNAHPPPPQILLLSFYEYTNLECDFQAGNLLVKHDFRGIDDVYV